MEISTSELKRICENLPDPKHFPDDYFKWIVMERPDVASYRGAGVPEYKETIIEFKRRRTVDGLGWFIDVPTLTAGAGNE